MTAADVLIAAKLAGVELSVPDRRLRCEFPDGALTPGLRDKLRVFKSKILELLVARQFGPMAEDEAPAWVDDPSLAIRWSDVQSSIALLVESQRVEAGMRRPSERPRRPDA